MHEICTFGTIRSYFSWSSRPLVSRILTLKTLYMLLLIKCKTFFFWFWPEYLYFSVVAIVLTQHIFQ